MSSNGLWVWLNASLPTASGVRGSRTRLVSALMSGVWLASTKSIVSTVPDLRAVRRLAASAMGLKMIVSRCAAFAVSQ